MGIDEYLRVSLPRFQTMNQPLVRVPWACGPQQGKIPDPRQLQSFHAVTQVIPEWTLARFRDQPDRLMWRTRNQRRTDQLGVQRIQPILVTAKTDPVSKSA